MASSSYETAINHDYHKAKCKIIRPLFEMGEVKTAMKYAESGYNDGFKQCEILWNKFELYKQ